MKVEKKKPGQLQKAKRKHRARQVTSDQLKHLRDGMCAGETVELKAYAEDGLKMVRVAPLTDNDKIGVTNGVQKVVCLFGKGKSCKLRIMWLREGTGQKRVKVSNSYHTGYLPWKNVFGKVLDDAEVAEARAVLYKAARSTL